MPPMTPLFTCAYTKSSVKTTPSKFDRECVDLLRKLCGEMNWSVLYPKSPKAWADSFRHLRQQDGIKQEDIARVLAGYCIGIKDGRITKPKLLTGEQFRKQWSWVSEVVAKKVPDPASHRAVFAAKKSAANYKWPKQVTMDEVAVFAQRVIAFAENLTAKLSRLKKRVEAGKLNTTKAIVFKNAVGNALVAVMGGADGYAIKYLERVRDEVRKWKDWSGDFSKFEPTLGSKYAKVRAAVLANGGSEEAWNMLKEELK